MASFATRARTTSVRRRGRRRLGCFFAAAAGLAALGGGGPAYADTWDNSSSNNQWSTLSNWADNSEPTSADDVIFPTPIPGGLSTIALSGSGEQAASITLNDNYSLAGGSVTLFGPDGLISVASGKTATITSGVNGSNGLLKGGTGTLILNPAISNVFTGDVEIIGTLSVSKDSALGNAANVVVIGPGVNTGTLKITNSFSTSRAISPGIFGGTIAVDAARTLTMNGVLGGVSNPLTVSGAGTLALNAASTRNGSTTIQNGTVRLGNGAGLGTGGRTVSNNGVLEIGAGVTTASFTTLNDTGKVRSTGAGAVHSGSINVASGANVILDSGSSPTHTLTIGDYDGGGNGNTGVVGSGTVILSGANSYTGLWEVDSGTLRLTHADAVSASNFGVFINPGGTVISEVASNINPGAWEVFGTLRVQHPTGLGVGPAPVDVTQGTLQIEGVTVANNVTLDDFGTLTFAFGAGVPKTTGTVTVAPDAIVNIDLFDTPAELGDSANDLTGGGAASRIHVTNTAGTSRLKLFQASDYVGSWNIVGAEVQIDGDDSLGHPANPVRLAGELDFSQSFSTNRAFEIIGGFLSSSNGSTLTMSAGLGTGSADVNVDGNATVVLPANTARGGVLWVHQDATVIAQTAGSLGAMSAFVEGTLEIANVTVNNSIQQLMNGATLRGTGPAAVSNGGITIASDAAVTIGTGASPTDVFTLGNADLTGGGFFSGITVNGAGKLVLTSPSDFVGFWELSSGTTLQLSADNQLGSAANVVFLNNGTFATTASFSTSRVFVPGGTFQTAAGTTLTVNSALSNDSGSITKTGAGTLALTATSARHGSTHINEGTVRIAGPGNGLGDGLANVNNGATLQIANTSIAGGIIRLNSGGTLMGTGLASYTEEGDPQVTNAAADVFINVPTLADFLRLDLPIRSAIGAPSAATVHVNGNGRLLLNAGETVDPDLAYGGSWELSAGILQVGFNAGHAIDALGFKNGDPAQGNTVTVNGGTLALGIVGSGVGTTPHLRANVVLNGGAIASTSGVTGQFGGGFTVAAGSTSQVLLFDPQDNDSARSVTLNAGSAGAGSTVWGANSTLVVDPGTTPGGAFQIFRTGGTVTVGANATLQINPGAMVNVGGAIDALSDGTNHVNVVNNSTGGGGGGGGGLLVSAGSQDVGTIDGAGHTTVLANRSLTAGRVRQNLLTIQGNARLTVRVNGGDSGTSRLSALNVNQTSPGGTLDLNDNDLILDYTGASPAAAVEALVRSGYNITGDWLGDGITSSVAAADGNFAIGVADNALLAAPFGTAQGGPLFSGQDVDLTSILVKFTHRADLNLDGVITPDDSAIFGGNYEEGGPARWSTGDLNYDGIFTPDDAAIFGGAYDESLSSLPEPAGLCLLGVFAMAARPSRTSPDRKRLLDHC